MSARRFWRAKLYLVRDYSCRRYAMCVDPGSSLRESSSTTKRLVHDCSPRRRPVPCSAGHVFYSLQEFMKGVCLLLDLEGWNVLVLPNYDGFSRPNCPFLKGKVRFARNRVALADSGLHRLPYVNVENEIGIRSE